MNEIRIYDFSTYDAAAVAQTKENVSKLKEDSETIWNQWVETGINTDQIFKIDFDFYSAHEEGVLYFSEILQKNGFEIIIKTKRMLFFWKGYELRATLNDFWTLKKLNERIELLGLFSRKYNLIIEGYGTHLTRSGAPR